MGWRLWGRRSESKVHGYDFYCRLFSSSSSSFGYLLIFCYALHED
jgi:hypothetical protein